MGEISRRLHRELTKLAPPGEKTRPPKGWRPQTPAPDIAKLNSYGDLLDQPFKLIVNAWNRDVIPWWQLLPQGVSGTIKKEGGYGSV